MLVIIAVLDTVEPFDNSVATMTTTHTPVVSKLWTATLLSGVLTAVLGVLVLAWPGKT